jgi:hypothetical protein
LEDRKRHVELCRQARRKAEYQFTLVSQSRRYLALIEDILG